MKTPATLSRIIGRNHRQLLDELGQFDGEALSRASFSRLAGLFDRMSASHYAEEMSLYAQPEVASAVDSRYFTSYHAMLENFYESIKLCGHLGEALPRELDVLRVLTRIHFDDEKTIILPLAEKTLGQARSIELAARYSDWLEKLCVQVPCA